MVSIISLLTFELETLFLIVRHIISIAFGATIIFLALRLIKVNVLAHYRRDILVKEFPFKIFGVI